MMRVEPAATLAAPLASPIVARQYSRSKRLVCRASEISIAQSGRATLPVRVCRSNQVQIPGWLTSREFRSSPNSGSMLRRKWPVAQSVPNRLGSLLAGIWGHQLSLPTTGASCCRNLGPYLWAFSHVVVQVDECYTAGVAAKAKTAFLVFITTLLAYSRGFHL